MKSLIVGNGLDIQFDGIALRGNKAILDRVIKNVDADKYKEIGLNKDSINAVFEVCVDTVNKIIDNRASVPASEDYLFLQMELERIKRSYKTRVELNEIGLEDLFISTEILYLNSINDEERGYCISAKKDFLQPLILDAIYDEGMVNKIYEKFPKSFVEYLKTYDAIFTLNYDTNIEQAIGDAVPVYHIHGSFDMETERTKLYPAKFSHMFCNGIMTWYWLEKYGDEGIDSRYGIDALEKIDGNVDILGISPCNDEQLYLRLLHNKALLSCRYFYLNRSDATELRKHIGGELGRHITDINVTKFWHKFK